MLLKTKEEPGEQSKFVFFFSIYSYTWNIKLGKTLNGLMMQSIAQKELRLIRVNGGTELCVGSCIASEVFGPQGSSVRKCSKSKLASCRPVFKGQYSGP